MAPLSEELSLDPRDLERPLGEGRHGASAKVLDPDFGGHQLIEPVASFRQGYTLIQLGAGGYVSERRERLLAAAWSVVEQSLVVGGGIDGMELDG